MAEQNTMTTIYEGLSIKPSPGDSASDLVSAIQSLYDEYKTAYRDEWDRLTANEKMYLGDHWSDTGSDSNEPQPVMPIIFSTVENIQADLMDEYQADYYIINSHIKRHQGSSMKLWFERLKIINLPRKLVIYQS